MRKRKQAVEVDHDVLEQEKATVERVLRKYPAGTRLNFGAPTRCPECGDFGLVEDLDVTTHSMQNLCLRCGTSWVITARALHAVKLATPAPPAQTASIGKATPAPSPIRIETGNGPLRAASSGPLRILHVEDDPADAAIVAELVRPAGPDVIDLRNASDRASGIAAALSDHPDLVLLDLGLPDSHGLQTIVQWQFEAADVPIVVVSGTADDEVVARARGLGVISFVDKAQLAAYLADGARGSDGFVRLLESLAA